MEVVNQNVMRKDTGLLVLTHLSQLLCYVIGFGGLITPLIIWLSTRDSVEGMNEQGREIVNFQLSLLLYALISIPAILLLGLGIVMLIVIAALGFIMPIVNAIKANRGETPVYPLSIPFLG